MTEFDQLKSTLLWASINADDCSVDCDSMKKLESSYEKFVEMIPEWIVDTLDDICFVNGDVYEQLAHDYIMTRMRHGVGFWETCDWEKRAGEVLTDLCHIQGDLETYTDNNKLYIL